MGLTPEESFLILPFILGPVVSLIAYWSYKRRWVSPIVLCAIGTISASIFIFASLAADSRPVYDPALEKIGIFITSTADTDHWMNLILFFEGVGFLLLAIILFFMAMHRLERNAMRRQAKLYHST